MRGSLTGSVVGNLLLVLGFSLLSGGRGEIDRLSSFLSLGARRPCTTVLLLIPAVPGWEGDPERDEIVKLSIPVSIVLLLVYVVVTWFSLRRHAALHIASDSEIAGLVSPPRARRPRDGDRRRPRLSRRSSSARSTTSPRTPG